MAKRFFDTSLLVGEYGIRPRERYRHTAGRTSAAGAKVRTLMSAFHRLLARETHRATGSRTNRRSSGPTG